MLSFLTSIIVALDAPNDKCRGSLTPQVSLIYPLDVAVAPSVGFIALKVDDLIGYAGSAEIILTGTKGKPPIAVHADEDTNGRTDPQTLHAALPTLPYDTYKIRVVLHDKAILCSSEDSTFELGLLTVHV